MLCLAWMLTLAFQVLQTFTAPPGSIWECVMSAVTCLLIVLTPVSPKYISLVQTVVQTVAALIPYETGGTPLWAIWFALAVIGFTVESAAVVAACCACSAVALGIGLYFDGSEHWSSNWLTMTLMLMLMAMIGRAIAWNRRLRDAERTQTELRHYRTRLRDAARLHDTLSGRLSYLALLSERYANEAACERDSGRFLEVRDDAVEALDGLHGIIDLMSCENDATDVAANVGWSDEILDLTRLGDDALHRIGVEGRSFVRLENGGALAGEQADACLRVIRELYANVMRHCPAHGQYMVKIEASDEGVTIVQSNTMDEDGGRSSTTGGRGLGFCEILVRSAGGWMRSSQEDDEWLCTVFIPRTAR